jgi:hypothetical protein
VFGSLVEVLCSVRFGSLSKDLEQCSRPFAERWRIEAFSQ